MKTLAKITLVLAGVLFIANLSAQDIVGLWKTIDDKTGKPKSVVKIYKYNKDGKYYGRIVKLFREPGEDPNPVCDKCSGSRHNQPIIGMMILSGLEKVGPNEWDNGRILDPESGNVYDVKMWIENGELHVRGYLGWSLIGRSQVWVPYKGN